MLTFLEWVGQLEEGFMSPQQNVGDSVCFGIHDLDGPIDVAKMRHCISPIQSVNKGHVLVERPQKTRHRGMKKMMSKDSGLLKVASGSLHKVPDEMVIGGDGTHKLFLYMPGDYHKGMAKRIDKKMMAADAGVTGQQAPQAQAPQTRMSQAPQAVPAPPVPQGQPLVRRQSFASRYA